MTTLETRRSIEILTRKLSLKDLKINYTKNGELKDFHCSKRYLLMELKDMSFIENYYEHEGETMLEFDKDNRCSWDNYALVQPLSQYDCIEILTRYHLRLSSEEELNGLEMDSAIIALLNM